MVLGYISCPVRRAVCAQLFGAGMREHMKRKITISHFSPLLKARYAYMKLAGKKNRHNETRKPGLKALVGAHLESVAFWR